jgi:hypothetical protein
MSLQRRFVDADRQDPVAEQKQGRAASDEMPSTINATVLFEIVRREASLTGAVTTPAELVRPVLGVLDGHVARCGTDVAKSAVPAHPLYVDPEARRGRSVLGR